MENRGFVGASDLKTGDKVRLQSGETAVVDSVEEIQLEQPIKVYNFEVEDFHTYYVSEQQVLVHNTCAAKASDNKVPNGLPKNKGFSSFKNLKKSIGSAGEGKEWHHIVEQSQIKKTGFSTEQIHNTSNIIAIDKSIHHKITGHYNSKPSYLGGKTVREWLSGKSFEEQWQYGMNKLKEYGGI